MAVIARRCREAIKGDSKEIRAALLAEDAEAGRSIRNTRDFANRKTKMTTFRLPDGTTFSSRRVMEKVIYDFYSELFDSHVSLHAISRRMDLSSDRFSLPKSDMPSSR
ncbi:hypothetical protein Y032_0024g1042 [Ancylostoma ceylanicum]|uniref:Uncharacterized protein n=1 Tax=Ancylostoma ceylanicum TaxID=53326 RepID=A0A016UWH7_9BILA|nr:hypothetical protein Y032_0024g1042 [Ancylostoma ceylanicum]